MTIHVNGGIAWLLVAAVGALGAGIGWLLRERQHLLRGGRRR